MIKKKIENWVLLGTLGVKQIDIFAKHMEFIILSFINIKLF